MTRRYVHLYARPDYTGEKIDYDRTLLKKAKIMNETEPKLKCVVRDLAIQIVSRNLPSHYPIDMSPMVERSQLVDNSSLPLPITLS